MISRNTFDAHLKGILDAAACAQSLKDLWAKYQLAKSKLPSEVLTWIAKAEPNLSDHGIPHIDNVVENAARLLGLDASYSHETGSGLKPFDDVGIKPVEAYILGIALMFHDTGNVLSRTGHADSGKSVIAGLMTGIFKPDEIRVIILGGRLDKIAIRFFIVRRTQRSQSEEPHEQTDETKEGEGFFRRRIPTGRAGQTSRPPQAA